MERKQSFIFILIVYLVAITIGGIGYLLLRSAIETDNEFLRILISSAFMDIIATLIVYVFSLFVKNTSLYDPYWSVWPFVLVLFPMIMEADMWNITNILVLIVVSFYAIRLTLNWAIRFKGLKYEDFRYNEYRNKLHPVLFELLNFFGFMFMPTVLVFLGSIPLLLCLVYAKEFNGLYVIGLLVTLIGVMFEIFADFDVEEFKKDENNRGKTLQTGIWKYSRHPNYLGEMTIWTGFMVLGLMVCVVNKLDIWWLMIIGSILIDILFITYSAPRMDKRMLERHADYKEYMERTSFLLLFPPKRK